MSNRATTLGKGSKYDFTKESKDKCPQFYGYKSDFDPKTPHSPRFTFGVSRKCYDKVYFEGNKESDKNVPGPGQYDVLHTFGGHSPKFSFKGKSIDKTEASKIPGPGHYNQLSLSLNGKYSISNLRNSPTFKFGNKDDKRFIYNCIYYLL